MKTEKINVDVVFGLSPRCNATLEPSEIVGVIARDIIMRVIRSAQPTPETRHTALLLAKYVGGHIALDSTLVRGTYKPNEIGDPINLDKVAIHNQEDIPSSKAGS